MKKILFAIAAIAIVLLTSCSSSNEPKNISPTSTDFTSGELAKLIEVVDEPSQLSYAEQDGAIATQFIKLKVKLRLIKESPELRKVDARDIDFTGLLSVATVNLVDENETKVQDLEVKSEDLLKLKKLLQGEKGDEETITFEGEFHNSKDAPKWFSQAAAFTPYLTGDIVVENGGISTASIEKTVHTAAVIKDPDGYTNVRVKPDSKAEIVAKILDGEQFFFDEIPGSSWVKVYRTEDASAKCIGYMHKSRVTPVGYSSGDDLSLDTDDSYNTSSNSYDELIERFAAFVSKLEGVKSIDERYLDRLENEYKEIDKSADGISVYDLSPTQQKRIRDLKSKLEKESERIKNMRYGF